MARKDPLARIPDEEPQTMARVEQLVDDLWPTRYSYQTWIESAEPRRHVAVSFGRRAHLRVCIEGAGATWREAFIEVEKQRLAGKAEGRQP